MVVDDIDLRAGGPLGAVARFVVVLGVLLGLTLGGALLVVAADRWTGNPVWLLFLAVALTVALFLTAFWAGHDLVPTRAPVTSLIVLAWIAVVPGGVTLGALTWAWSDRQVLHDRGVVVHGTVGRHWDTGYGATIDPGPFFSYDVSGPDGSRWSFRTETAGERPVAGAPVTLTADPRGEVRPHLGERPAAPPSAVVEALRYVVAAGALGMAAVAAAARERP